MRLSLTMTQSVMLACAPILMVAVSLFERRWGPRVAGVVAAAPVTAMIGLLLVHSDLGTTASQEMALRMGGYVPAQIGIAAVVVALVRKTGYLLALALGVLSYAGLAWSAAHLPVFFAITFSVLLLTLGRRIVPTTAKAGDDDPPMATAGPWMIGLRAAVSLATAFGLLLAAQQFGPAAGGAIGAFPIFTFTLCSFIYTASGPRGVHLVLAGMVHGLPPYFAFVLAFAVTTARLGAVGGTLAAAAVCTLCYLAQAHRSRTARTHSAPIARDAMEHRPTPLIPAGQSSATRRDKRVRAAARADHRIARKRIRS